MGWKVRVHWPAEKAWFYGEVTGFDASTGRHRVSYEDGDEREVTLGRGRREGGLPQSAGRSPPRGHDHAQEKERDAQEGGGGDEEERANAETPRGESTAAAGGLRGSHGIRAAAADRRRRESGERDAKRARSTR